MKYIQNSEAKVLYGVGASLRLIETEGTGSCIIIAADMATLRVAWGRCCKDPLIESIVQPVALVSAAILQQPELATRQDGGN